MWKRIKNFFSAGEEDNKEEPTTPIENSPKPTLEIEVAERRIVKVSNATDEEMNWAVLDSVLKQPLRTSVHPYPDILGFKVVNFAYTREHVAPNGFALLWLQIPTKDNSLYFSEESERQWVCNLHNDTKYRAGRVRVIGVQFFGSLNEVKKMALAYVKNQGFLRSMFDPEFHYEVEEWKEVAGVNSGSIEQNCGQGIHFFTNWSAARSYVSVPSPAKGEWPIVTRKTSTGRENVVAVPSAFLEKYNMPPLCRSQGQTCWRVFSSHPHYQSETNFNQRAEVIESIVRPQLLKA